MNDAANKTNAYDKKTVRAITKRYHNILNEMESSRGAFMADVKELLREAKEEHGIPKKLLRMVVSEQRQDLKRIKSRRNLEESERSELDILETSLGDFIGTELGQAAVANAA